MTDTAATDRDQAVAAFRAAKKSFASEQRQKLAECAGGSDLAFLGLLTAERRTFRLAGLDCPVEVQQHPALLGGGCVGAAVWPSAVVATCDPPLRAHRKPAPSSPQTTIQA